MNKAGKHILVPMNTNSCSASNSNENTQLLESPQAQQKNVINSIMSFLPDNRPITSLQIVEDYEKCPKNFIPIHRTYDQDADADLWRENNILFGRQTTRYLCLSKTEGLPEYVVETLKVIAEKMQPPKEFSALSRTADSEQKAWRKRQIAYKLSKKGSITQAITDIILCSKLKIAPEGFKMAGDINGILICYKTSSVPVRLPPPVPTLLSPQIVNSNSNSSSVNSQGSEIEKALNLLNLVGNNRNPKHSLPPLPATEHDYEEISASYQISSPQRPAKCLPIPAVKTTAASQNIPSHNIGTLGSYCEVDGVPFVINPTLVQLNKVDVPTLPYTSAILKDLDYDFTLERQILCTIKSSASKNPFFK